MRCPFINGPSRRVTPRSSRARDLEDLPTKEAIRTPDWNEGPNYNWTKFYRWVEGRVGQHWDQVYGDLKVVVPPEHWDRFRPRYCSRDARWELGRCYFDEDGILHRPEPKVRASRPLVVPMGANSHETVERHWQLREVEDGYRETVTVQDRTRYCIASSVLVYRKRDGHAWEEVTPDSDWYLSPHVPRDLFYFQGKARTLSKAEKTRLGLARYEEGPEVQSYTPPVSEGPSRGRDDDLGRRPENRRASGGEKRKNKHELPAPPTWGPSPKKAREVPLGAALVYAACATLCTITRR